MKNIKLLEEKILLRDSMLKFMLSGEKIDFDCALKLNNEIAENSFKIKNMKTFPYSKLQNDANDYIIKIQSKLNEIEKEI